MDDSLKIKVLSKFWISSNASQTKTISNSLLISLSIKESELSVTSINFETLCENLFAIAGTM